MDDNIHAAHLAQLEGALLGLLREGRSTDPMSFDEVVVQARPHPDAAGDAEITVLYSLRGHEVSGEML